MLTLQERKALKDMIDKTSSELLLKYKEESIKDSNILFIGDSMIEYLNHNLLLPNFKIANRGIAGATTKLIDENFEDIFGDIDPQKIFVSVGSNNLVLLENSAEEAANLIIALLTKINFKFPFATIYYLSTTPVVNETSKVYKKLYVAGRKNKDNQLINQIVSEFCNNDNLVFINQYDVLLNKEGYLDETLTPDGIHLNKSGYNIYVENLKSYLNEHC